MKVINEVYDKSGFCTLPEVSKEAVSSVYLLQEAMSDLKTTSTRRDRFKQQMGNFILQKSNWDSNTFHTSKK